MATKLRGDHYIRDRATDRIHLGAASAEGYVVFLCNTAKEGEYLGQHRPQLLDKHFCQKCLALR